MTQSGLAHTSAELLNPREVLTSALEDSILSIFRHYGVDDLSRGVPLSEIPPEASIGARIQFANRQISVALTLFATPQILDATHPAPPEVGITSADLRNWALELCNQLSGALRSRLVRFGIHAQPGLPQSAQNHSKRRPNPIDESLHTFISQHGQLYIKLACWADAALKVSETPEGRQSLAPGQMRLF